MARSMGTRSALRDGSAGSAFSARFAKRAIDLALAGCALVVLSPVMLLIGIVVRLTSRGPALFSHTRLGQGREPFTILKYRTMDHESDDAIHRSFVAGQLLSRTDTRPVVGDFKLADDPRITRVGKFLRKASLDELPQLINVLRGEMSLVGPRPCLPWEMELFEPAEMIRFEVRPGITGLWQVSGRGALSMKDALALDAEYVRRRGTALDLAILLRTIPVVLSLRGAA